MQRQRFILGTRNLSAFFEFFIVSVRREQEHVCIFQEGVKSKISCFKGVGVNSGATYFAASFV